ncbi:FKBP-type peptidyl-prolyl cis-trans isomerase [Lysobacter sp. HDW10]|uniref:FKBP-type peptidyl-prolyl cis-trans isomerase n=1 Tax=Lysobacter sp. HDW10 TaxID=2714936 RepID=UPI00197C5709|nr:FKBP-type peptidyl-prolyl cis-trans isomerase [Lysobacter sp. HDW10]
MSIRKVALPVLAAATVALMGCNNPAGAGKKEDAKTGAAADAKDASKLDIPGLKTEREQVSYMVGLDMGRTLKPAKDDIDLDVMLKGIKDELAEGKKLMDDKQADAVREAFGQKMQAKQIAAMLADQKKNAEAGTKFLAENAKKAGVKTTPSGLQYQVITEGTGPKPKATDFVKVHYRGTLLDGKEFDSSYSRNEPTMFPLNRVIPGWSEGVQLMPVGSKYKFWIPSELAYGEQGTPGGPIPPNAMLTFELELLSIEKAPQMPKGAK